MLEVDPFWRLKNATVINSQKEFYDHLDRSDHLKSAVYSPDELSRRSADWTERIEGKRFEGVSFSKTRIRGIIFRNCIFVKCQFIASDIEKCEFHGCKFIETNTHKISIRHTYLDPLSFEKCLDRKKHQNLGVHLYQVLMNNCRDEEQIEFERDAQFLFLRWKRYQDEYEVGRAWAKAKELRERCLVIKAIGKVLRRFAWEKLFGCGVRLRYFLRTVIATLALATIMNFAFRVELGLCVDGEPISTWSEAVYFTTVSLTTLGYGDIVPTTALGRVVASVQSVVGFSLFALLASMLFRRVAP